jgi:hypothetical protein
MSTTVAPPHSGTAFVKKTRIILASRQAVYEAWTLPEIFMKWWGPVDHVVSAVELDVREGGALRFTDDALPHASVPPGFPAPSPAAVFTPKSFPANASSSP